jgi:ribonuclease HI
MISKNLIIYTDGACKGNPGPGGWGFWLEIPKGYVERCGGDKFTTNNAMELTAAIKALQFVLDHYEDFPVVIYTDSNYVKKGITEWMNNWVKRGWKTAAGKPVKNKNLWIALSKFDELLDVEWRWVKGHSMDPGNERADMLANKGVPA